MNINKNLLRYFFITDIIRKGSYVLYSDKSEVVIKEAFGLKNISEGVFIPKMVSRKKDFLPNILSAMDGSDI